MAARQRCRAQLPPCCAALGLLLGGVAALVQVNSWVRTSAFAVTCPLAPQRYSRASGRGARVIFRANSAQITTSAETPIERYASQAPRFDIETAVLLAGFAFETYNTPDTVRWELGEDGLNVALLSDSFVPNVYKGVLTIKLIAVEDLREETGGVSEAVLTGARSDPYVLLNVMEDGQTLLTKSMIATGALNEGRIGTSLDVKRSSTLWRGGGQGRAEWQGEGDGELVRLYVKDLSAARLGFRVMDENVASADELLGASELELAQLLTESGTWMGKVPLVYKEKSWDWGLAATGAAASAFTGLATGGASLAIGAAAMMFKAISPADQAGSLELELNYQLFESTAAADAASGVAGRAPVGATPGVDWGALGHGVGGFASEAADFDFLGFVSHQHTSTEAGIWRNTAQRKIILAFRGTEMTDVRDLMTDVNIAKTPWESREEGDPEAKDTEPHVHAGFREALDSVAQRLKALLNQAVRGLPDEWEVLITGHSLGGALATLMAMDLADGLDAAKGLPVAPRPDPWFLKLFAGKEEEPTLPPKPKFRSLSLYTFGAPRVGNAAFSAALDAAVPNVYRVVNSQDVVCRVPRVGYQHAGRTVLLDKNASNAAECRLWVEGEAEGRCPLRDDSVLRSPMDKGSLLGDLYNTYERGPIAALSGAAQLVGKAAEDIQGRLGSAGGTAQVELQELAAAAGSSVEELRLAGERAATLGDRLAEAYKAGASKEELRKLEDEAAKVVAADLNKALQRAETLGKLSGSAGNRTGSLGEAAAALSSAEAAAAEAARGVSEAFAKTNSELAQRMASATFGDFTSIIGIDAGYADNEVQLLQALGTGQAVVQHLEGSYYESFCAIVNTRTPKSCEQVAEVALEA